MISKNELNSRLSTVYSFGEFRFEADDLLLFKLSEIVPLAPKALQILHVLIEADGSLVTKEEILKLVWADTFVEESNLTHHISAIRKALGEDKNGRKFIETVPRRGYRFVAPVSTPDADEDAHEIVVSERITSVQREIIEVETVEDDTADVALAPAWEKRVADSTLTRRLKITLAAACGASALLGTLLIYQLIKSAAEKSPSKNASEITYTRVLDNKSVGNAIISPDGKFVAYYQNFINGGGGTIFLRQIETNREVTLIEPGERVFGNMDFSPDGEQIVFVSFEKEKPTGEIYAVPILGGVSKRLVTMDANVGSFALSPDGKQLAFFRHSKDERLIKIVTVGVDEASESEKIAATLPDGEFSAGEFLAWSPDGRFLTVPKPASSPSAGDAALFQIDLQSGERTPLVDAQFKEFGKLRYSRDGKFLYFIARNENNSQQIYRLERASRQISRVTNDSNIYSNYGLGLTADDKTLAVDLLESKGELWSVSADGKTSNASRLKTGETNGRRGLATMPDGSFVYTARIGEKYDLWITSPDGQNSHQLTNDAFEERMPTVSHDGRYIVFSSNRSGDRYHLFRINADGSEPKQLTDGASDDWQPDISPDDSSVIYVAAEGEKSIVKKIPLGGGNPFALTDYSAINPVYSPDGTRIALKLPSGSRNSPGTLAIISADGGKPVQTFSVAEYEWLPFTFPVRWTPDGKAIVFRLERDNTGNLWQQNLDGSPPQQLTNFSEDTIYNFVYSPDKSRILLSRGLYQTTPYLIKNF